MIDWFLDPFQYAFMQRALLGGALAAAICAVVGTWVVLRGLAFMGDALAHGVLPGIAQQIVLIVAEGVLPVRREPVRNSVCEA